MLKRCVICDRRFESPRGNERVCSEACDREQYERRREKIREYNREYRKARVQAAAAPMLRRCAVCGKEFDARPRGGKHVVCCSEICTRKRHAERAKRRHDTNREQYREFRHEAYARARARALEARPTTRRCPVCATEFVVRDQRKIVCSPTCNRERRNEQQRKRRATQRGAQGALPQGEPTLVDMKPTQNSLRS
jgi:hypothetical protein